MAAILAKLFFGTVFLVLLAQMCATKGFKTIPYVLLLVSWHCSLWVTVCP